MPPLKYNKNMEQRKTNNVELLGTAVVKKVQDLLVGVCGIFCQNSDNRLNRTMKVIVIIMIIAVFVGTMHLFSSPDRWMRI